jgi:pimeloyl-ACP methyl ester carboxylesterase
VADTEFIVERGGVALSGQEAGEGIPVVLLHGLTATRRYVVMGSRSLERAGHRVIAYDARAHGRSSPAAATDRYEYADLADDLLAILDDRAVDRAVLVGASMGAHTLLRVALDHGDRVAGIVVVTPAYTPDRRPSDLDRWDRLSTGLRTGGVEGFVAAYGDPGVPESWRDTVVKVLRQRLAAHDHPDALADALRVVPRSIPFTSLAELEELDLPAIVVGSRDEADPGHPLAVAEAYAARIPGAELRVEEPGSSPLAWQGGQLSRVIAELAARTG